MAARTDNKQETTDLPQPKKSQVQSHVKVILTVFFYYKGIFHHKYAPIR